MSVMKNLICTLFSKFILSCICKCQQWLLRRIYSENNELFDICQRYKISNLQKYVYAESWLLMYCIFQPLLLVSLISMRRRVFMALCIYVTVNTIIHQHIVHTLSKMINVSTHHPLVACFSVVVYTPKAKINNDG